MGAYTAVPGCKNRYCGGVKSFDPDSESFGMVELLTSLCLGLGIAAACGLRVFLPLLFLCLGAKYQVFTPSESFAWIGSWQALTVIGFACVVEVLGYSIPFVDHALDALKVPASFIAAAGAMAAQMGDVHPVVTWAAALIAGGVATGVSAGSATIRATSTATTGGLANPIVSMIENVLAAITGFLAIVLPIVIGFVLVLLTVSIIVILRRRKARREQDSMKLAEAAFI